MVHSTILPKDLSVCSPYKFVGAAGGGVCGGSEGELSCVRGAEPSRSGEQAGVRRRSLSRLFKCITAITDTSEAEGLFNLSRLTGHSPHTPLGFFHPDMTEDSFDSEAERIRERDLDDEALFDIYVFEERTNEYAFSYT